MYVMKKASPTKYIFIFELFEYLHILHAALLYVQFKKLFFEKIFKEYNQRVK